MDLNHLKLLVALDSERNITKAAEKLCVSQSAASHSLAKLRDRLQDPLFVRTANGMEPTPFTQTMLPMLRRGLNTISRSLENTLNFEPLTEEKVFNIGASPYFEFIAMPGLADHFHKVAPRCTIRLESQSEREKMDLIESGRLDLFVGVISPEAPTAGFNSQLWLEDDYVGLVPETSNLSGRLTIEQFTAKPQVYLSESACGLDPIDLWLIEHQYQRNIQYIAQSYSGGGMICVRTGHLFPVPRRVADQLVAMLPLRQIELPPELPQLRLSVLSHELSDQCGAGQWLLSEVLQQRYSLHSVSEQWTHKKDLIEELS